MGGPETVMNRDKAALPTARADTGPGGAVADLFGEHNAALMRFLKLRLDSEQEARDVAQEAYVRLLQLDKPGTVSFLRAYLFKTASNLATDQLRRRMVRRVVHADPVLREETDELDPERAAMASQQLSLVQAALRALPGHIREAFLLHRLNGLSVVEIGQRMGVSERTARNYVIHAMLRCRYALGSRMDAGEEQGQ